jgi:anthranilate synthase component I
VDVRVQVVRDGTTVAVTLPGVRDLLPLAAANSQRYPCLLESVSRGGNNARYDILFAFPRETIELNHDGIVSDQGGVEMGAEFLATLDKISSDAKTPRMLDDLPFHGGWFLFLSYEFAAEIEPRLVLPESPERSMPVALAVRCPAAIVVDHHLQTTTLIAEASNAASLTTLRTDIDSLTTPPRELVTVGSIEEDDPRHFLDGVSRIHNYLRAGDTFQVNLSREWRTICAGGKNAASLYAKLRRANPAPFAGLLQWKNWSVLSSSPERLIETRDGIAQTRPIAGTRPRVDGDKSLIQELIANPKERAEHVMLIDLERNDLGRVCEAGSVQVDEMMSVESYAHVHHIVSNVRGKLRANTSPGDVIRAVFPGGTITGCPKVRCMEIIAELEGVGRGAYTGALGYLDCNGDMDLNILIRTFTLCDDRIRFRAGAGIVADSDAQRELDETRAKAQGLLRALG